MEETYIVGGISSCVALAHVRRVANLADVLDSAALELIQTIHSARVCTSQTSDVLELPFVPVASVHARVYARIRARVCYW